MKKLTELEEKITLGMKIKPNMWQDPDLNPPSTEMILKWCEENDISEIKSESDALNILKSIEHKIADPEDQDSISIEDEATWVLSKMFTREQLLDMNEDKVIAFLQDWKYYFGFRKMEGWGDIFRDNAIDTLDGKLVLDEDDDHISYISIK